MYQRPAIPNACIPLVLVLVCVGSEQSLVFAAEHPLSERPALRRPVAAAVLADGRTLAVANRRSGTISLVELDSARVIGEYSVGARLSDLAIFPNGRLALAADEGTSELLALNLSPTGVRKQAGLRLSAPPSTLVIG